MQRKGDSRRAISSGLSKESRFLHLPPRAAINLRSAPSSLAGNDFSHPFYFAVTSRGRARQFQRHCDSFKSTRESVCCCEMIFTVLHRKAQAPRTQLTRYGGTYCSQCESYSSGRCSLCLWRPSTPHPQPHPCSPHSFQAFHPPPPTPRCRTSPVLALGSLSRQEFRCVRPGWLRHAGCPSSYTGPWTRN
jgi:hypothetical protein